MRFSNILVQILNYNGVKDTLECLESLAKTTNPSKFATLLIDNASIDESVPILRARYPEIPILKTKKNLGFAGGNNVGFFWALSKPFEWILLLNNDTRVAPDMIEQLVQATRKQPNGTIFGAKSYRYLDPQRIDHLGGIFDPKLCEFVSPYSGKIDDDTAHMEQVDYVSGCALFMHRSVLETIGFFEERFFLLWEETDFCTRAKKAGFEIWTAPQAKLWHKVSSSFTGGKPHLQYFWWRNRLLWVARNCSGSEKRELYKKVLFSEILKCFKLAILKTLQEFFLKLLQRSFANEKTVKAKRFRAGCLGILHFYFGKFGNCPKHYTNRIDKQK